MEFVLGEGKYKISDYFNEKEKGIVIVNGGSGNFGSSTHIENIDPEGYAKNVQPLKDSVDELVLTFNSPMAVLMMIEKLEIVLYRLKQDGIEVGENENR